MSLSPVPAKPCSPESVPWPSTSGKPAHDRDAIGVRHGARADPFHRLSPQRPATGGRELPDAAESRLESKFQLRACATQNFSRLTHHHVCEALSPLTA
jgi:hypothetical protein